MGFFEFMIQGWTQAAIWGICVALSGYISFFLVRQSKKMSFGEDTGAHAWILIALGLLIIGLRVSFKVLFADYDTSFVLQVWRFMLGIVGIIVLYMGIRSLQGALRRLYGVKA